MRYVKIFHGFEATYGILYTILRISKAKFEGFGDEINQLKFIFFFGGGLSKVLSHEMNIFV